MTTSPPPQALGSHNISAQKVKFVKTPSYITTSHHYRRCARFRLVPYAGVLVSPLFYKPSVLAYAAAQAVKCVIKILYITNSPPSQALDSHTFSAQKFKCVRTWVDPSQDLVHMSGAGRGGYIYIYIYVECTYIYIYIL